jgi:enoyl-CoA hydratase/carnithine racemase
MSSPSSSLILERGDGVLQITLNRPDVLNSFTREMAQALRQVLAEAATDDAVRAVVLTGAGRGRLLGSRLDSAVTGGETDLCAACAQVAPLSRAAPGTASASWPPASRSAPRRR